jgi:hypothetical protein
MSNFIRRVQVVVYEDLFQSFIRVIFNDPSVGLEGGKSFLIILLFFLVEMHTDGKPRVVMMCDVGVSKGGGVCGVFVRRGGGGLFFPTPLLLSIILSLFSKYTFSSYASRSTCRDTKRQPRLKRFFFKEGEGFLLFGKAISLSVQ